MYTEREREREREREKERVLIAIDLYVMYIVATSLCEKKHVLLCFRPGVLSSVQV